MAIAAFVVFLVNFLLSAFGVNRSNDFLSFDSLISLGLALLAASLIWPGVWWRSNRSNNQQG